MRLQDNLRKQRAKSGLSQEGLAEKVSVSRQTISKWETGETYPSTKHILMLTNILNCDMNDLIDTESASDKISNSSIQSRTCNKRFAYLFAAIAITLSIATLSFIIPAQINTYLNEYSRINSLKAVAFDRIIDNSLDEKIAADGYIKKQTVGYGVAEEDGVFYIKCNVESGSPDGPCAAIIYFCEDDGVLSFKCQYLDDPNYLPKGEYHKIS